MLQFLYATNLSNSVWSISEPSTCFVSVVSEKSHGSKEAHPAAMEFRYPMATGRKQRGSTAPYRRVFLESKDCAGSKFLQSSTGFCSCPCERKPSGVQENKKQKPKLYMYDLSESLVQKVDGEVILEEVVNDVSKQIDGSR